MRCALNVPDLSGLASDTGGPSLPEGLKPLPQLKTKSSYPALFATR